MNRLRSKRSPPRRAVGVAMALAALALAPTAGNIGSCGQEAESLDPVKFFTLKSAIDCSRCTECGLVTLACDQACNINTSLTATFPEGCLPLIHDGEVCLDALLASDCDDYAAYVADTGATIPTECNFCPVDAAGEPVAEDDE